MLTFVAQVLSIKLGHTLPMSAVGARVAKWSSICHYRVGGPSSSYNRIINLADDLVADYDTSDLHCIMALANENNRSRVVSLFEHETILTDLLDYLGRWQSNIGFIWRRNVQIPTCHDGDDRMEGIWRECWRFGEKHCKEGGAVKL